MAYDSETIEKELLRRENRAYLEKSFYLFYSQFLNGFIEGWWIKDLCQTLQDFIEKKEKKTLIILSPPQHGKTSSVYHFVSWLIAVKDPMNILYSSYSEDLGFKANRGIKRIMEDPKFSFYFDARIKVEQQNTSSFFMYENPFTKNEGIFNNVTIGGSVTGKGAKLFIIDDPHKDGAEARSEVVRNNVWEWYTTAAITRLSEDGQNIIIMTRWHEEDLVGKLLTLSSKNGNENGIEVFCYPAIAMKDELNRKEGEPLFREIKSLEFLLNQKSIMPPSQWECLYQQNPGLHDEALITKEDIKKVTRESFLRELKAESFKIVEVAAHLDYAFSPNGDYNAFTIMVKTSLGVCFTYGFARKGNVRDCYRDIIGLCEDFDVSVLYVENNLDMNFNIAKDLALLGLNKTIVQYYREVRKKSEKMGSYLYRAFKTNKIVFFDDTDEVYLKQILEITADEKQDRGKHDDAPDSLASLVAFLLYNNSIFEVTLLDFKDGGV